MLLGTKTNLRVYPAEVHHAPQLAVIDADSYEKMAASEDLIRKRILLLNSGEFTWFWVAELNGVIVADIILQPTHLLPEECTSWGVATNNGTLESAFEPEGDSVFGVSLGKAKGVQAGVTDYLIFRGLLESMRAGKRWFMLCSRMQGFASAHEADPTMTPERYWQARRGNGELRDAQLSHFEEVFGHTPRRLLIGGYEPDHASGGHAVLFVIDNLALAIVSSVNRFAHACFLTGLRSGRSGSE